MCWRLEVIVPRTGSGPPAKARAVAVTNIEEETMTKNEEDAVNMYLAKIQAWMDY
jgi:hypothetical protein